MGEANKHLAQFATLSVKEIVHLLAGIGLASLLPQEHRSHRLESRHMAKFEHER